MLYSEASAVARKRINAIANAVATMDRPTIKEGLRFGKRVGKEYYKELAFTGDVSDTFSARRQFAIQEASVWLASNSSESFMERKFEQSMNDAMDPILRNPAFRNPDEMDQISTYVAQAVMSIFLEDSGFLETEDSVVVKTLRTPWTSVFGSAVFLIRS